VTSRIDFVESLICKVLNVYLKFKKERNANMVVSQSILLRFSSTKSIRDLTDILPGFAKYHCQKHDIHKDVPGESLSGTRFILRVGKKSTVVGGDS
jgi:hypothetical protein